MTGAAEKCRWHLRLFVFTYETGIMMGWMDDLKGGYREKSSAGDLVRSSTVRFWAEQFTMIPIGFIVQ